MSDNPIDALIDDVKARPVPYAVVAALGVAGAVVLASRSDAAHPVRAAASRAVDKASAALTADTDESVAERTRELASSAGLSQGTVAVFVGTLLSKAVTGFMRYRAEEEARYRASALSEATGRSIDERLDELTVAELRELASEREVSGRSTMNKDELIDALSHA